MEDKVIEKIQKLLSLATSPNENEARAAAEKANELLIRYNLTLQDVGAPVSEYCEHAQYRQRRLNVEDKFIVNLLLRHFFVKTLTLRGYKNGVRGTTLLFVGTKTNVQVASYIHEFLLRKYRQLWEVYKEEHGAQVYAKQPYYGGLTEGLDEQLRTKRTAVETETGLMVIKDPRLEAMVENMGKHHTGKYGFDAHAREHGLEQGKKLHISRGVETSAGYAGRALAAPKR